MKGGSLYRQGIPDIELYIEQATEAVPSDGRYYLVLHGEVVTPGHARLKDAQAAYKQKLDALGWKPPVLKRDMQRTVLMEEEVGRYLKQASREKHQRASRKGGKGGRGGVA